MRIQLVFKSGLQIVATVTGVIDVSKKMITIEDYEALITTVPQLIEKVTGLRLYIEQV